MSDESPQTGQLRYNSKMCENLSFLLESYAMFSLAHPSGMCLKLYSQLNTRVSRTGQKQYKLTINARSCFFKLRKLLVELMSMV